jgi:hypothetical protein
MMNSIGIGHNQGPPMGGLSTLPVAEKAIGGAIIKGVKSGLKSLSSMFESVGSGLKKTDLKKDERKEAASAIQNEIDKVSKANNRKFKPKILRMETRPNQTNNFAEIVVAAVDEENGKVAAILDGRFSTKIDKRKTFKTGSGGERENKNFNKEINYLNVGGFFPIQSSYNYKIKEILESLNVPVYGRGEGVISPEDLAILNKRQSEGAMGHTPDKLEMGATGTLGFSKSLRAGLPITDAGAGRVSGAKGEGGQLNIRGASIMDTAAPMESLPDIDVSMDMLGEMGDTGLNSLTPEQLSSITQRRVEGIDLPPNVKRISTIQNRMDNVIDDSSARKDPYAARLVKEKDNSTRRSAEIYPRKLTIGELYPKETMIEKLQYGLLSRLSGGTSGKKGLMSLIKRGEDEMIVGRRSPTDQEQVMVTADGERLAPKSMLLDPRVRKERVGINRNILDDNPEPPENLQGLQRLMGVGEDLDDEGRDAFDRLEPDGNTFILTRQDGTETPTNLLNMDDVTTAYNEGRVDEQTVFDHIRLFEEVGMLSMDEAIEEQVMFREMLDGLI